MADLGYISLLVALVVSAYTIAAYALGLKRQDARLLDSARNGVISVAALTTLASIALFVLLAQSDFSIAYVAHYTSRDLPMLYKLSAFWAGNEGSLLLWVWVLALESLVVLFWRQREGEEMVPYVMTILMFISLFFLFLLNFVSFPFARLAEAPPDGNGLNPLLQNPGMLIHPTTQYIGYVGFAIPYAYAITALFLKKTGDAWIRITRRYTLWAWLFLGIGMIYGGQWAYVELGWGGYWAWDPVENASLLPWLTATAFFHSVMIQERKGMLKTWNIMLIIITFVLTIFGTFLSRSGVLASVHAFGDNTLGAYFMMFMGIILAFSLYLAFDRINLLKEDNQFEAVLSKESSFLLNNLLLVGAAFAVFWGTVFPLISEAVRGVKVTVGQPFFNQVNVPIGLAIVILIGICPLVAWRKASWENLAKNFLYPFTAAVAFAVAAVAMGMRNAWAILSFAGCTFVVATIVLELVRGTRVRHRMTGEAYPVAFWRLINRNRRRYGGYIVHLAVILMVVGITGSNSFDTEVTKTLAPGESMTVNQYTLTFDKLGADFQKHKATFYADLKVTENGKELGIIRPGKDFHHNSENPTSEVGILGGLDRDLFTILADFSENDFNSLIEGRPTGDPVTIKVLVNPLVAWIWLGEYLMILGTLFAMWPERRRAEAKYEV